jgi:two-component system nitrate/nitrite response regulator NarP
MTRREHQIADLVAQGDSNKIIAFKLGLTEGTVKQLLHLLYNKLGVDNRTQLANLVNKEKFECDDSHVSYS